MSQSQLHDLSITLMPPPEGSLPENIASIILRYDIEGLIHMGDVLTDPLKPNEYKELRWYLEDYWKWPYEQFLTRGKQVESLLEDIGKRLYKAAFGSTESRDILQAWRHQHDADRQISIISDVPRALSLPWELLRDEQGFLVLRTRHPVSILRRLPQREAAALSTTFDPPLRILLVTARPEGAGFMDPRGLARELLDEVQSQVDAGAVDIEFLRPPTRTALRERLKDSKRPVHVLHFDGHGIFEGPIDPKNSLNKIGGEQGKLAFEDADGKLDLVKAEDLAQILLDSGVRLAVLDACQSAMGSSENAFSSVATRLIQSGVDAVIAMSASVLVASSTRFFETFYRELAAGTPAPTAQERARQSLYDDPRRHLMSRKRDEEGQPVELRDWWLPHFYQQRALTLRATRAPRKRTQMQQTKPPTRFNDAMPPEPRYRFSGRSWELLQVERALLRKQMVVLSGFGGVGKTALAREAADWLTRTLKLPFREAHHITGHEELAARASCLVLGADLEFLSRPEWVRALLDSADKGKVQLTELSLDQRQTLAQHPNKAIRDKTQALLKRGGSLPNPDREKVLQEFLPITKETGDAAAGKVVFKNNCAKCHVHSGEGTRIGPDLTGMAVHTKEHLLTDILDPSRSVEGNFRAYLVTLKDGRVLTGLLASESKTAVEIYDAEGKKQTILRSDIDTLEQSPKSLMPDGFEKQVTKKDLTDLLEFLTARGKYLPLPLEKAATVVSTRGMFNSEDSPAERMVFDDWSPKTFKDVPFNLIDPRDDRVPNVILLNGPQGKIPPKMPKSVTVPCNAPAKAIHLLSGVSGWGFPGGEKGSVSLIVRLHYADGKTEDHALKNGEHFADYIRRVDVPASQFAFALKGKQQVRYLAIAPERTETSRGRSRSPISPG